MRDSLILLLAGLVFAVAGCDGAPSATGGTETAVAEAVIQAFMSAFTEAGGEDGSVSIANESWDKIAIPPIAAGVELYTKKQGVGVTCSWTAEVGRTCPGSNPLVFVFYPTPSSSMISVGISSQTYLSGEMQFTMEVIPEAGGWRMEEPAFAGVTDYIRPEGTASK